MISLKAIHFFLNQIRPAWYINCRSRNEKRKTLKRLFRNPKPIVTTYGNGASVAFGESKMGK